MEIYSWFIVFLVLLVIEVLTLGLTTIWFAAGALVAFFANLLGANLIVQIVLFLLVSVLMLVFTRPIAKKYFNNSRIATNAESLLGEKAVVITDIDTIKAQGRVEIKGQEWAARTKDPDGRIETGKIVEVLSIKGVHLVVTEKEEK